MTYLLLWNLMSSDKPQDKLVEALRCHFKQKPEIIVERFHFHWCNQHVVKSIADNMVELHQLSTHCQFDAYLQQALRTG